MKLSIKSFGNEQLKLRPLAEDDLPLILAWRNEARIWFKDSTLISMDQHKKWFEKYLEKNDDLHFIVEVDKTPVGQAAVYHIQQSKAEVGRFLVAPMHEGKGYIKQACAELVKFCRDDLKLRYLFLEVLVTNHKAIELYKKNGFKEEKRDDFLIRMGQFLSPNS